MKTIQEQLEEKGIVSRPVSPPPPAPAVPPIRPGTRVVRRKPPEEEPLPLDVPEPEEERPMVNVRGIRTAQMIRTEALEKRVGELEEMLLKLSIVVETIEKTPVATVPPSAPSPSPSEPEPSDPEPHFDLSHIEGQVENFERELPVLRRRVSDLERLCAGILIVEGRIKRPEVVKALLEGKQVRPTFKNENGKLNLNIEIIK